MSGEVRRTEIVDIERLSHSADGNPRYRVMFRDGRSANTAADSACAYELPNRELHGVPVNVHLDGRGCVTRVVPAEQSEPTRRMP